MSPTLVDDPVLTAFADDIGPTAPVAVRGGGTQWNLGGELDPGAR